MVQGTLLNQTAEHWVQQVGPWREQPHTGTASHHHPSGLLNSWPLCNHHPLAGCFKPLCLKSKLHFQSCRAGLQVASDLNKTCEEVQALWETPMTEPVKLAHNRFITAPLYYDQVSHSADLSSHDTSSTVRLLCCLLLPGNDVASQVVILTQLCHLRPCVMWQVKEVICQRYKSRRSVWNFKKKPARAFGVRSFLRVVGS